MTSGSARLYYQQSIKAAQGSGDKTLVAYMMGSLTSLSLHEGDTMEAFYLLGSARKRLGGEAPAVADAWLGSLAGLAYATAGQENRHGRRWIRRLRPWRESRTTTLPPGRGCSHLTSAKWPGSAWPARSCSGNLTRPRPQPAAPIWSP